MQICKYTTVIGEHQIKTQKHQILQHISYHILSLEGILL